MKYLSKSTDEILLYLTKVIKRFILCMMHDFENTEKSIDHKNKFQIILMIPGAKGQMPELRGSSFLLQRVL